MGDFAINGAASGNNEIHRNVVQRQSKNDDNFLFELTELKESEALSDKAVTLDNDLQMQILEDLGIDTSNNKAGSKDNFLKIKNGDTAEFYRIVKDGNEGKLIHTLMKGGKTEKREIFKLNRTAKAEDALQAQTEPKAVNSETAEEVKQNNGGANAAPIKQKTAEPDVPKTQTETEEVKKETAVMQVPKQKTAARAVKKQTPVTTAKPVDKEAKIKENTEKLQEIISSLTPGNLNDKGYSSETLKSLINDKDLSASDFAKVIKNYETANRDTNGIIAQLDKSSLNDIERRELQSAIGRKLTQAANTGDENTAGTLCREIYSGTAGLGDPDTAQEFLDEIFNNANEKTLKAIAENYGKINNGRNLCDDLYNKYFKYISDSGKLKENVQKLFNAIDVKDAKKADLCIKYPELLPQVINAGTLSSSDFGKFMKNYADKSGNKKSLTEQISKLDLSAEEKTALKKTAGNMLFEASVYDKDARKVLCRELYSAIDGLGAETDFIESVFNNRDLENIKEIVNTYKEVFKGRSLYNDFYYEWGINSDIKDRIYKADKLKIE